MFQKGTEMFSGVLDCLEMFSDVLGCSEMFSNVENA